MQNRDKQCSFCGSGVEECKYLISGPLVYICDVCVEKAFNAIRASEADGGEGGLIDLFDAIADALNKD